MRLTWLLLLVSAVSGSCHSPDLMPAGEVARNDRQEQEGKVEDIVARFRSADSERAGRQLAENPELARASLPRVLSLFRDSLAVRSVPWTSPGQPGHAEGNVRRACFVVFTALGPAASEATPELLRLLYLREVEKEFGGARHELERAIAETSAADPTELTRAAKTSDSRGVRYACCYAMGLMKGARDQVIPALLDRLGDDWFWVVVQSVASLSLLHALDGIRYQVFSDGVCEGYPREYGTRSFPTEFVRAIPGASGSAGASD